MVISRAQRSKSVYVAKRAYDRHSCLSVMSSKAKAYMAQLHITITKAYMTQLYISVALSLDQGGDQPRAAKQKHIWRSCISALR